MCGLSSSRVWTTRYLLEVAVLQRPLLGDACHGVHRSCRTLVTPNTILRTRYNHPNHKHTGSQHKPELETGLLTRLRGGSVSFAEPTPTSSSLIVSSSISRDHDVNRRTWLGAQCVRARQKRISLKNKHAGLTSSTQEFKNAANAVGMNITRRLQAARMRAELFRSVQKQ